LLQCVVTLPDVDCDVPARAAQHALGFDELSVRLNAQDGTTVVFDSFSHEGERMEWSALVETVNGAGDISRHADWTVRVSGNLSAVLGPENIAAYRALQPKVADAARPVVTEFDEEIQELKRHCAGLSDLPSKPHPHRRSVAEALLSMTPGSFADVLRSGNPTPLCTPPDDEVSAAVSALCEFGRML
jgi:hypothetical protein